MRIAIIVLNWNGAKYISSCLDSLKKLNTGQHHAEVIIVDNGSTDNSISLFKEHYSEFTLVQTGTNLGYAAGNNVGLVYAQKKSFDWAWIVNPDIQVHPKALLALLAEVKNYQNVGAVGSKVYFAPGFEFHKDRYTKSDLGKVLWFAGGHMDWANVMSVHTGLDEVDKGQYNHTKEVDFLTGSSMLLSINALKQVGMLDSKYFLYFEETDLCQRLKRDGFKLLYVPTSIVWHANAQATSAGSGLVDYYTTRSRLLFGMRWAPLKTKLHLIKQSLHLLFTGRSWQKRGVIDFYLGKFGKGSYA